MDEHEVTKRLAEQHSIMETKISRKFIEEHAPFNQLKRWTALAVLFVLTVIVISLLFLYSTPPERIFVTNMKANTFVYDYSKNFGLVLPGGQQKVDSETYVTTLLTEEGDILFTENFFFPFDSKNDSFQVLERDSVMYINGQLAGVLLDPDRTSSGWLKKIPSDSFNNLQTLMLGLPISRDYLPELKRISQHTKNVSIGIFKENDDANRQTDVHTIAKLFTPDLLYIEVRNKGLSSLAEFKTVKTLVLDFNAPCDQSLPPLPNLRQCIIQTNQTGYINNELFKNNRQVEKLAIITDNKPVNCMPLMKHLPGLKELSIDGSKLVDLDSLYRMAPLLRTLVVGDSCKNIDAISKFKDLKWLGLPREINQKQFDAILNGLPGLEVLEMYGNDSIKNIRSIVALKDLKGLVIAFQLPDSSTLFQLKQLRYLSIPEEKYTDSLYIQKLAKALPGCVIVPNGGACLGSGWLLLLIPFVAIIIYFRKTNANAARQL